eukprot:4866272-Heterocapsa_arctica.AAC.1
MSIRTGEDHERGDRAWYCRWYHEMVQGGSDSRRGNAESLSANFCHSRHPESRDIVINMLTLSEYEFDS